jgi:hypothetical protein
MPKVTRTIVGFRKSDSYPEQRFLLYGISWDELKDYFDPGDEDPDFIGVYNIDESYRALLQEHIDGQLDFENYIYQLDCYQVD